MNAKNRLRKNGPRKAAQPPFCKPSSPQAERGQALALLSTARSERSA
jgi:hypothetical protein